MDFSGTPLRTAAELHAAGDPAYSVLTRLDAEACAMLEQKTSAPGYVESGRRATEHVRASLAAFGLTDEGGYLIEQMDAIAARMREEVELRPINLTPHDIVVVSACDNSRTSIPPSGTVARVSTTECVVGVCPATGAPIVQRTLGDVTGLPPEGTPCIVSAMVAAAVPGRRGVFAPDSGSTAIRDERGLVVAVTRLIAA